MLVIGSRLNIRQVSYNWSSFAKNARIVQVNIDPARLAKPFVQSDLRIVADAGNFLAALSEACTVAKLPDYSLWAEW